MKLLISEILDLVQKEKSKEKKKEIFLKYETPCLRGLMRIAFDKTVSMGLPEGEPPYKKVEDKPIGIDHVTLEHEYRKFYIWLSPINLSKTKKELLFIQLLESLHYKEAEVMILCKDQRLSQKYPSITEKLIRDIWPFLMPPKEETQDEENLLKKSGDTLASENVDMTSNVVETKPKRRPGRPKKVKV